MTQLLPCVEVEAGVRATASVIWLHGLGADGHDFEPLVPHMKLPHVRFVFPNAPAIPITINGGFVMPGWYDIRNLELSPHVKDREDPAQIRRSADAITALLARERERSVPPDRIVLAGFSQGGAMANYVAPRHPERLAGYMVLSAYELLIGSGGDERLHDRRHQGAPALAVGFVRANLFACFFGKDFRAAAGA